MKKLRVAHFPQVPCKPFYVEVSSPEEGARMMNTLANYDLFQLENRIKSDYSNVNMLEMYDESLTDQDLEEMELEDRWCSWFIEIQEDVNGEYQYFECPYEYVDYLGNLKVAA